MPILDDFLLPNHLLQGALGARDLYNLSCCGSTYADVVEQIEEVDSADVSLISQKIRAGKLPQLTGLRIWKSPLVTDLFQNLKCLPKLIRLDLDQNRMEDNEAQELAKNLVHVPALTWLNLSHNAIKADGVCALSASLRHVPALTHLDLSDNTYVGSRGGIGLADGLVHVPKLTHLDMRWMNIRDEGLRALSGALKYLKALRYLGMYGNDVTDECAQDVSEGLRHVPQLAYLTMSWAYITNSSIVAVATSSPRRLTHLKLNFWVTDAEIPGLVQALQQVHELIQLDLTAVKLNTQGIQAIAECLKFVPKLTGLRLMFFDIPVEGTRALSEGLKDVPALTRLELLSCKDCAGAEELAKGIRTLTRLDHLLLQWGPLHESLPDILKSAPLLKQLQLGRNYMSDEGAKAVSSSLRYLPRLTHLDLESNRICDEGVREVAKGLQHVPHLTHLDLGWNKICDSGAMALAESHTPVLTHLKLVGNPISDEGACVLAEALAHVPNLSIKLSSWVF